MSTKENKYAGYYTGKSHTGSLTDYLNGVEEVKKENDITRMERAKDAISAAIKNSDIPNIMADALINHAWKVLNEES